MLYFRNELLEKYDSTYKLEKALQKKELFKIQYGLYSDKEYVGTLEIISKKYPEAILTSNSAFYYQNLTDVIPSVYYLATARNYTRIDDKNIKQIFVPNEILNIGKTTLEIENVKINIYNKERLLVELVRKKNKIPFDYYKEIISNYRNQVNELDVFKLQEYISMYSNEDYLFDIIQSEVF